MAIQQNRAIVVEDTVSPQQNQQGSVYCCIPKRMLRSAGIDPDDDELPEEFTIHYHKSGDRKGEAVIDLEVSDDEH